MNTTDFNVRSFLEELANARDTDALRSALTRWAALFVEARYCVPKNLICETQDTPKDLAIPESIAFLLRRLWVSDEEAISKLDRLFLSENRSWTYTPGFFRADWRRSKLVYQPHSQIQHALFFLLEHSTLLRLCGNPDCDRPYFIAEHGNDRYCKKKCFNKARSDAKRAWWGEHGEQWRSERERLARKRNVKSK